MKSALAEKLQKHFDSHMLVDTRPLSERGVGERPGTGKRLTIVGATVTDVTPANPTDGGVLVNTGYTLFGPQGPSIEDINQGQRSDCYALAALGAAVRLPAGVAYLKKNLRLDPNNPQRGIISYFRSGTITNVHFDLLVSTQEALFNPANYNLWVQAFEKTYAFFRSGADTYASLDFGLCSAVFSDLGMTPAGLSFNSGVNTIATLKAQLAAGIPCTMLTPFNAGAGMVSNHAYTVIEVGADNSVKLRNPWGAGPWVMYPVVSQSDFNSGNLSYSEFGTLPAVPLPTVGELVNARIAKFQQQVLSDVRTL